MPQIDLQPYVMGNCLLRFKSLVGSATGTGDFEKHVSQVEFVPTAGNVPFKGLTPTASYTFATNATWVCNLAFAQDWETTDSLSQYLFDNEGELVEVDFEPVLGGATVTATLTLAPGSIGGTVDGVAVSSVSLGVQGKPVFS